MTYHCFSRRQVRARDTHYCVWCCAAVLPGSHYVREHSVADGSFQNFAWHEACRKAADDWFDEAREEEFISGNDMPYYALYQLEKHTP